MKYTYDIQIPKCEPPQTRQQEPGTPNYYYLFFELTSRDKKAPLSPPPVLLASKHVFMIKKEMEMNHHAQISTQYRNNLFSYHWCEIIT